MAKTMRTIDDFYADADARRMAAVATKGRKVDDMLLDDDGLDALCGGDDDVLRDLGVKFGNDFDMY